MRQLAVGQARHRIEGVDRPAVGPDDMDLLGRLAVQLDDLGEVEHARPIDRLVALPHHVHEGPGGAEHVLDVGRGEAEGGIAVVAAKRLDLLADHVADRRPVAVAQLLRRGRPGQRQDEAQDGEKSRGSGPP